MTFGQGTRGVASSAAGFTLGSRSVRAEVAVGKVASARTWAGDVASRAGYTGFKFDRDRAGGAGGAVFPDAIVCPAISFGSAVAVA